MSTVPMWWQHLAWFLVGGIVFNHIALWAQHKRKRKATSDAKGEKS